MRIVTRVVLMIFLFGAALTSLAQKKKTSKEDDVKTQEPSAEVAKPPAQSKPLPMSDSLMRHYQNKYTLASRWNDSDVAKNSLYDMIILNPKSDSLIFMLAYFYFENQQYAPATLVSQDLLSRNSKNLDYLELSAASFESLGILDRALQNYETEYLLANSTLILYKIAFLQYELKRYEEAWTNVDILLSKQDSNTIMITFNDTRGNPKDYPMKVPVMNLKGLVLEGKGDIAGAKKAYEEVVKLAPDFEPAVSKLAELSKK